MIDLDSFDPLQHLMAPRPLKQLVYQMEMHPSFESYNHRHVMSIMDVEEYRLIVDRHIELIIQQMTTRRRCVRGQKTMFVYSLYQDDTREHLNECLFLMDWHQANSLANYYRYYDCNCFPVHALLDHILLV